MDRLHRGIKFDTRMSRPVNIVCAWIRVSLHHRSHQRILSTNAAEALQKLGGAQVVLATAPSSKAMSELINGLGSNGKLMVIGATFDPIEVTPIQLISGSRSLQGRSREHQPIPRTRCASPKWDFDDATFDRSAASFDNPDHVSVVIHNYPSRLGLADGEPKYDGMENLEGDTL